MQVKFSKYERVAGMFVLVAGIGFFASIVTISVKLGWFQKKFHYYTKVDSVSGIRKGTPVEITGIQIGRVDKIEFTEDSSIRVRFFIQRQHKKRIREGTIIRLIRPYVIGDKVLEMTMVNPETSEVLLAGAEIPSQEVAGLLEILNGQKLLPYMKTIEGAFAGLREFVDFMIENQGTLNFAQVLKSMLPLIRTMNTMAGEVSSLSRQLGDGNKMRELANNMLNVSRQFNRLMPMFAEQGPEMTKNLSLVVANLASLTNEFKAVLPAISKIAPELPRSSRRMIEAIDEAVVVLKAMQKSFLLRGSVREVREEERKREESKDRSFRNPAATVPRPIEP